ncbi:type IV pilin protein [Kaarinaea lacus]
MLFADFFYPQQKTRQTGFSLLELLIVIAILAILISIAIPAYENYLDNKNIAQAKADVLEIQVIIDRFYVTNNRFPNNLAEIGENIRRDPWGNNYYYTNISTVKNKGSVRKDKNLTPVNSDYDLYSAGKDGLTSLPFTAKNSNDDIVRCNNGSFIGLVADY